MLFVIGGFYITRGVLQSIFLYRYIPGTYWLSPGFPSLVVPYGDSADYYYSGHTGFMCMTVFFLRRYRYYVCSYLAFGATLIMISTLILFRIHYSIGKDYICFLISRYICWCTRQYLLLPYCHEIQRPAARGNSKVLEIFHKSLLEEVAKDERLHEV